MLTAGAFGFSSEPVGKEQGPVGPRAYRGGRPDRVQARLQALVPKRCDAFSVWHPAFLEEDSAVWRQGKIWARNTYEKVTDRVNGQRRKERKHHRFVCVDGAIASPERTVA